MSRYIEPYPDYPPEYDRDPIDDCEKYIKEVEWALMNWDTKPGEWENYIKGLIDHCKGLMDYINEME